MSSESPSLPTLISNGQEPVRRIRRVKSSSKLKARELANISTRISFLESFDEEDGLQSEVAQPLIMSKPQVQVQPSDPTDVGRRPSLEQAQASTDSAVESAAPQRNEDLAIDGCDGSSQDRTRSQAELCASQPEAEQKCCPDSNAIEYMRQWTEYLGQWTAGQSEVGRQILEQQTRLESLIEELLKNSRCALSVTEVDMKASPSCNSPTGGPRAAACAVSAGDSCAAIGEVLVRAPDMKVAEAIGSSESGAVIEEDAIMEFQPSARSSAAAKSSQDHADRHSHITDRSSLGRLHSVFVQAIWNMPSEDAHSHHAGKTLHWTTRVEELVEDPRFEYFCAGLILAHSFFIGVYVEYVASVSDDVPTVFKALNVIFTSCFAFEVLIKTIAERWAFFTGKEMLWNIFDCLLLATVLLEIILSIVLAGKRGVDKKKMKTILKLAEMARTMRILRIFQVARFSDTLRVLLSKIAASGRILLWIVALLCIVLFVVAVCMTQAYNDFLLGQQHEVALEDLEANKKAMDDYFGSIPRSAYTLASSVTGGLEWGKAFDVLAKASPFYAIMFFSFVVLTIFVGMNVLTGIFVDDAIRCDTDIIIDLDVKRRQEQSSHLRLMFGRMNKDDSDVVTIDEFLQFAHCKELGAYLQAINIEPSEAETLFHLLDWDGSGEINIDEFVFGCMHLRGEATSLDMKTLLYESRRMRHRVFKHITSSEGMLTDILAQLRPGALAEPRKAGGAC